jgi:hypothetical protein
LLERHWLAIGSEPSGRELLEHPGSFTQIFSLSSTPSRSTTSTGFWSSISA